MIINLAQKQPRSQAPPLHFSHRQREVVEKERGWLGNLALKHIAKIKTKVSKSAQFRIKTNQQQMAKFPARFGTPRFSMLLVYLRKEGDRYPILFSQVTF